MEQILELAKLLGNSGIFAIGALFGAWLATHLFKAGHESMIIAYKESENRCKVLLDEQRLKDARITELHRKLSEREDKCV